MMGRYFLNNLNAHAASYRARIAKAARCIALIDARALGPRTADLKPWRPGIDNHAEKSSNLSSSPGLNATFK